MHMMLTQSLFAAALLAGPGSPAPAAPAPATVVAIRYDLDEMSAERIQEAVAEPLARSLRDVARVKNMVTTATHRLAEAELVFEDGATEADLADIVYRLDRLRLDAGIAVEGRSVALKPCRLACEDISASR
ncbi:hypothetical protein SRABI118_04834 [Massilia sp. Bi118]|uniref:hypothetical protein n=1 Tax=Massilia sp. Bi118 TaxID=2822346 RepID=UPI001D943092|nr:hypothetical protein [Massilia sp. Bi118]CAH0312064.1 hypothetical protein SRABI118_04834 [Massilia sp. Bi118]